MRHDLPEIAKSAQRVRAAIEEAVTRFQRRHRYAVGADLRERSAQVVRCVWKAWRHRQAQLQRVRELSEVVDELKLDMMLAADVSAFRSTAEFESVARIISDLGRQVGGWLKALHSKGQNAQAVTPAQRAQTLSSRAASIEANP